MIHTKFQDNRLLVQEKKIFNRFLPYIDMAAMAVM